MEMWSASRPGRLTPGKEPSVPIGWEAGWAQESVWTQWWREKFPASPDHPARSPALYRWAIRAHWIGKLVDFRTGLNALPSLATSLTAHDESQNIRDLVLFCVDLISHFPTYITAHDANKEFPVSTDLTAFLTFACNTKRQMIVYSSN